MNSFVKLVVSLMVLCSCEQTTEQSNEVVQLAQDDLATLIAQEDVVLIDVRTPGEISEGYIDGTTLFINFSDEDFEPNLIAMDKSKTYVMYCRSGGRSGKASKFMVDNGFKTVYNLEGGISNYTGKVVK